MIDPHEQERIATIYCDLSISGTPYRIYNQLATLIGIAKNLGFEIVTEPEVTFARQGDRP